MVKKYPRGANFVKKTFHEFFTTDTIDWFRERGVELKTEADGRMFPVTDSSQTIINCLLTEADKYGVMVRMGAEVKSIEREGDRWKVSLAGDKQELADIICVASGGYPRESMFDWLRKTGHSVEAPVPSLFTFNMPRNPIVQLMGVSAKAKVKIQGTKLEEEGPVLITHWGLSGPAVLKLSARGARELNAMNYRFVVLVNWCDGQNEMLIREALQQVRIDRPSQKIVNGNIFNIAQRLWLHLISISGIDDDTRWADLSAAKQNLLVINLSTHEMEVEGKTTYKEEFVTAGGIKLTEVDAHTMQSRILPRLYFAGEILDVDGVTGGFNFQHAWTSGWVAAKAIASSS
jgi:predicted Rossmann fold flavoprotein